MANSVTTDPGNRIIGKIGTPILIQRGCLKATRDDHLLEWVDREQARHGIHYRNYRGVGRLPGILHGHGDSLFSRNLIRNDSLYLLCLRFDHGRRQVIDKHLYPS